jgi:hypothetical protein
MAQEVAVADTMAVAQACLVVEVVTAAAAADHLMRIKRLHQPSLIPVEIIIPTVIVQLLGPVQDVVPRYFQ